MICMPAWRYGAALALTVGLLYIACALLAVVMPDAIPRIVTVVVHGLNIGGLTGPTAPPRAGTMVVGLVYVSLYAFVAGWLFGAVRNAMARASAL